MFKTADGVPQLIPMPCQLSSAALSSTEKSRSGRQPHPQSRRARRSVLQAIKNKMSRVLRPEDDSSTKNQEHLGQKQRKRQSLLPLLPLHLRRSRPKPVGGLQRLPARETRLIQAHLFQI